MEWKKDVLWFPTKFGIRTLAFYHLHHDLFDLFQNHGKLCKNPRNKKKRFKGKPSLDRTHHFDDKALLLLSLSALGIRCTSMESSMQVRY